jgi:hypothetical protein
VHCVALPAMVRSVGFTYDKTCVGVVPRSSEGGSSNNTVTVYASEEVVSEDEPIRVTDAEKSVFSG